MTSTSSAIEGHLELDAGGQVAGLGDEEDPWSGHRLQRPVGLVGGDAGQGVVDEFLKHGDALAGYQASGYAGHDDAAGQKAEAVGLEPGLAPTQHEGGRLDG